MGAWGHGPYQNDTACDFLVPIMDAVADAIEVGLGSTDDDEVRAAAWLYGQVALSDYTYDPERRKAHGQRAIAALERMAHEWDADREFFDRLAVEAMYLRGVVDGDYADKGLIG